METQPLSGDLILVSKIVSPSAVLLVNASGGTGLLICSERSKVISTNSSNSSIELYKILIDGKISHVTKDRILKILSRGKDGLFLEK